MKKDYKAVKIISVIIMLITIGASVYAYQTVKGMGVLPQKYIDYILYGLIGFNVFFGLLAFIPKVSKLNKILQSVICTGVAAALIAASIIVPTYKGKIERAFTQIPEEGSLNINVYTLASSPLKDVSDLETTTIGVVKGLDEEYTQYALKVISRELNGKSIKTTELEDVYSAFEALFAGEIPAVMINETYAEIIADNADFANFSTDTKILYNCIQPIKINHDTGAVGNITTEPFIIGVTASDTWNYANIIREDGRMVLGRSDVNMVVACNPNTKQILIVTVPRDSYLGIGGNSNMMDKLTHHTLYGYDTWKASLNKAFGIEINYFVRINFQSLVNIVNALDGIDINNPYEMTFEYNAFDPATGKPHLVKKTFEEGLIHLTGEETLGYVRDRYHSKGGDMGRNKHQAIVIKALVDKVTTVSVISKIDRLLEAIQGSFVTDLGINQIYALVQMQLDDMATWDILSYSLTGTTGSATSYALGQNSGNLYSMVFLDKDSVNKGTTLLQQVLSGVKLTSEDTAQ